jgi:hypothetical protein
MSHPFYVQPVVRAWIEPAKKEVKEPSIKPAHHPKDEKFIVFDTETTTDEVQRLRFGAFLYGKCSSQGEIEILSKGLFLADEPALGDDNADAVMQDYAKANDLEYMNCQQFCDRHLWKHGFKGKATIIGFNLPFDISRIAIQAVESRRKDSDFSFRIFRDKNMEEYKMRPSIRIKKLGPKKQSIRWGADQEKRWSDGEFVDVNQLVTAHCGGSSFTLANAAKLYGTVHRKTDADYAGPVNDEYLGYCVNDTIVTLELYQAALRQHLERDTGVAPSRVFSTASLSKGLMTQLGVIPTLTMNPSFPPRLLGQSMAAFIGARTEAHVVNVPVPGQLLDFTSMYPTVGSLMNLSRFLRTHKVTHRDATAEVRELLAQVSVEGCFDPELWPKLTGLAIIAPGQTLTLPVRGDYGSAGTQVSLSKFTPSEPMAYAIPDLVAAAILDGTVPQICSAWVLEASSINSPFLSSANLPGDMTLDLQNRDIFRSLVELRQKFKSKNCKGHCGELECIETNQCQGCVISLYLKIQANGLYGIFAEINQIDTIDPRQLQCYSEPLRDYPEDFTGVRLNIMHAGGYTIYSHGKPVEGAKPAKPETPGTFCFPPLAMLFTSGARLMLAMLERRLADLGGTYAMMDTDSMFIVATPKRSVITAGHSEIQAISYAEVAALTEEFQTVSPYTREDGEIKLLKQEYPKSTDAQEHCLAISSKRYCLFRYGPDDSIVIDKRSEHGLGYLKSPANDREDGGWKVDTWRWIVSQKLGLAVNEPDWFDGPAIGNHSISTPWLFNDFKGLNAGRPYQEQIKPFNFMTVGYQPPLSSKTGRNIRLVAPFFKDLAKATDAKWFDLHTGNPVTVRLPHKDMCIHDEIDDEIDTWSNPDAEIELKTFGGVMHQYVSHAELKAGGPDGRQATGRTTGQLSRLHVVQNLPAKVQGKDMNEQDEQAVHLTTEDETTPTYFEADLWQLAKPVLSAMPIDQLALAARISPAEVSKAVNIGYLPDEQTQARLIQEATQESETILKRIGLQAASVPATLKLASAHLEESN